MFNKTIAKILGLALLITATGIAGCASTGAEPAESFTGQSSSSSNSVGSTHFEWSGKGAMGGKSLQHQIP